MTTLQHANRILRPRRDRSGQQRGTDRYHSAAHGRPTWWGEQIEESLPSREFIGVLEQIPGSQRLAIVLYEDGMLILDEPRRYVAFDDIYSVVAPFKEPPPIGLQVRDRNGAVTLLPFEPPGLVFTLFMALSSIADERRRLRSRPT